MTAGRFTIHALRDKIDFIRNEIGSHIVQCSNPMSIFTATLGSKLFCNLLRQWNLVLDEIDKMGIEPLIFTLLTGGAFLVRAGEFINRVKPMIVFGSKLYHFVVLTMAYFILYIYVLISQMTTASLPYTSLLARTSGRMTFNTYKVIQDKISAILLKKTQNLLAGADQPSSSNENIILNNRAAAKINSRYETFVNQTLYVYHNVISNLQKVRNDPELKQGAKFYQDLIQAKGENNKSTAYETAATYSPIPLDDSNTADDGTSLETNSARKKVGGAFKFSGSLGRRRTSTNRTGVMRF